MESVEYPGGPDRRESVEVHRARALSGRDFLLPMKFLNSVKLSIPSLSLSNFLKHASTCTEVSEGNALSKSLLVTNPSLSLSSQLQLHKR